jgi:hypothetical protein
MKKASHGSNVEYLASKGFVEKEDGAWQLQNRSLRHFETQSRVKSVKNNDHL